MGPRREPFEVDAAKLTLYSPYFVRNCEYTWKPFINLPNEDPRMFACFVNWLLGDGDETALPDLPDPSPRIVGRGDTLPIVRLWVMAERLEIEALKNDAMDVIREYHRDCAASGVRVKVDMASLHNILQHVGEDREMLRYLSAKIAALNGSGHFLVLDNEGEPNNDAVEFLAIVKEFPEVVLGLFHWLKDPATKNSDPSVDYTGTCEWHVHTVTPRCS